MGAAPFRATDPDKALCLPHCCLTMGQTVVVVRLQHKVRWLAYILVGMLVVRAFFVFLDGAVGEGVGIFIAAVVIVGCQLLLERDFRKAPNGGRDTHA